MKEFNSFNFDDKNPDTFVDYIKSTDQIKQNLKDMILKEFESIKKAVML